MPSRGSSASGASSDVAFIAHDGARLSGSGIAVGLQSKGTAVIHRADLQPLDNLELFGMSPLYSLDSYRAMGRNAAAYALGRAVGPVPTELDNFARAKLIVRTTLLHARETAEAEPRRRAGRAGARVKVYFAGPLFSPYERGFIDECAGQLRAAGFDVFVPHEHELALDGTVTAERIFAKDWSALVEANAVLALLDGPVIDDGTACEIGIFYALMQGDDSKKGVVGLVTDMRATRNSNRVGEVKGLNLFVVGCIEAAGTIVTDLDAAQAVLEGWR